MRTKEIVLKKVLDGHKVGDVITTSVKYANWLVEKGFAGNIEKKKNKIVKPK
jgi:hypothetical protein